MSPVKSSKVTPTVAGVVRQADALVDGRVGQFHRAAEVDRALAGRTAAGAGAGREDHGVGALDVRGKGFVVFEVAEDRDRPDRPQVGLVVRGADQAAGGVTLGGEQFEQAAGDLTVAAGDEDVHPSVIPRASLRAITD